MQSIKPMLKILTEEFVNFYKNICKSLLMFKINQIKIYKCPHPSIIFFIYNFKKSWLIKYN